MTHQCIECGDHLPESHTTPICEECIDDYSICENCKEWFRNDDRNPYCDECRPDFYQCPYCGKWEHLQDMQDIPGGEPICEDCFEQNFPTCYDCNTITHINDIINTALGNSICSTCYQNNYFTCENCNEVLLNAEYAGDGECHECESQHKSPYILDYSYKPSPILYGETNPYYGIELETDNYNDHLIAAKTLHDYDEEQNLYYLKQDGSLTDEGIEIVFHPRNFKSWEEFDLNSIIELIKKEGGKSYNASNCGLHIHRSNKDITTVTKIKLVLFFLSCSEQIIKLSQRKTEYAKFFTRAGFPEKGVCYKYIKNRHHIYDRNQAINFQNRKTIEFRVFRGTLKLSTIMAYLGFCHYVVEFCKNNLLYKFTNNYSIWDLFVKSINPKKNQDKMAENLYKYLERKDLVSLLPEKDKEDNHLNRSYSKIISTYMDPSVVSPSLHDGIEYTIPCTSIIRI